MPETGMAEVLNATLNDPPLPIEAVCETPLMVITTLSPASGVRDPAVIFPDRVVVVPDPIVCEGVKPLNTGVTLVALVDCVAVAAR